MMKYSLIAATVLTLIILLSGCAAVLVGGAAAGTVAYVRGDLEAVVDHSVDETFDAAVKAMNQLDLSIISRDHDKLTGKIVARDSEDSKITVTLKSRETGNTELRIRVGVFGDEALSRRIYDQVRENL